MSQFFDEVDDRIVVADHSALTLPNGDWSLGGWVQLVDNAGGQFQYFLSWGAFDAIPSLNWYFIELAQPSDQNKLRLTLRDDAGEIYDNGGGTFTSSTTPGTSTAWQHLLLVRSGTTLTMYVNGSSVGSATNASFAAVNVAGALFFGSRSDLNSERFLGGRMGEWFKINRALSAPERAALANGISVRRLNGIYDSGSWYYPFWGEHSPEIQLVSSGPAAGTVTGSIKGASHPPVALFTVIRGSVPLIEVAGGGSFAASMALAMGMTVAPVGKASAGAGVSMASDVGMTDGAGAAALAAVLAQSAATLTAAGKAGAAGAVSLTLASAIAQAAKADTSAIIALTHDTAITALAQAVAIAGLDLTAAQSLIATAATQAQSAVELILTSAAALAASGQVTAASDVSLALAGMLTQAAQAGAAGAITLNQDGSITVSGTKVVFVDWALAGDTTLAAQGAAGAIGSLALSHDTAIAAIAQAVTAAGFGLASIQSLTITSSGVTAVLALPDGRTITISAETRILKVGAETRIFKA